ncbi:MAG TPA: hypothetical protein VGX70_10050, partial [Gemmataceae bacterium]|nr:hypothetical protein [Gemmataceae bacterium]
DKTLMNVFYGEPLIALREFPEAKFKLDATRIFPSASKEGIERLVEFGKELLKIQHGCMLAITADAAIEADRLDSQCIRVRPFPITPDLLSALTKMDGALLIDPEGTCHALGVILDGRASKLCDSSRGSRYNSAIRYVIGDNNIKAMAIVKSEDGMLDVIPDLHPKIRRSEVRNAFQILQALAAQKEPDSEELSRT